MEKRKFSTLIIMITILTLTYAYLSPKAYAQQTTIQIEPSHQSILIGNEVTINVTIKNVTDLAAWELKIYYENAKLNGTYIAEGPFLKNVRDTFFYVVNFTDNYNATHGRIWATCTLTGSGPGANGTGTLLTVKFKTKQIGTTSLHITDTDPINTAAETIPHTTADGTISIVKPPTASFTYSPTNPRVNQTVTFDASTSTPNGGTITTYAWNFGDGNTTSTSNPIIRHTYTTTGIYNVTLTVTDSEGLTDTTWKTVNVTIALIHDIAITNMTTPTNTAYPGWIIYINVTVQNQGDYTETFDLTVYANTTAINTQTVTNLNPAETRTITFQWNTTDITPCQNLTIWSQAQTLPDETETEDNTLTDGTVKIKMPGDVDGNGKIDYKDLFSLAAAYGISQGDPRYKVDLDFNLDGKIDYRDLFTLAANYGKSC